MSRNITINSDCHLFKQIFIVIISKPTNTEFFQIIRQVASEITGQNAIQQFSKL